jgi:hypothetical protein
MSKLTVKEFATIHNISVQSVYKRIQSGSLECREINNTKYIIINDLIDYEKKFNDLQHEYNTLKAILELKEELIQELKANKQLFNMLLTAPREKPEKSDFIKIKKKNKKNKH